uniref:Reverse transcriptase domain-containing protein n=1 Tax=Fagus sylvatica TaxID=28930 RepID=A0A2N9IZ60_FAGSY
MRIRVVVDITKPLCRGRKIGLNKGSEGWFSFKHERLPNFCYWCGLLTHEEKDCNYWLKNQEVLSREEQGYVDKDKSKKPTGSSWKRIVRNPVSPTSPARRSPTTLRSKRAHQPMIDLDFKRDPKKNKAAVDSVHELSIMVRKKDPIVLFLSETKLDENQLEVLRCQWRFRGKFVVPSRGQSGGLVMYWSGCMRVSISSYSQHHIDAVLDYQSPNAWRFTGFYGSPTVEGKATAWSILRTLRTHHTLPWLCAGDFNKLLSGSEKWGRRPRPEHQMSQFRQVVDDCGFMDLGFTGPAYTWCNNQTGYSRVLKHLDRSLATTDWLLRFPNCLVHHMHMAWEADCRGSPMFRVSEKIKASRRSLHRWSKQCFGSVRFSIEVKTRQLEREEATALALQNVQGIMDEDGIWQQEEDKIELAVVSYYKSLFTSANLGDMEEVLNGVSRVVSSEMNDQLIREFTASEMRQGQQGYMALKLDMSKAYDQVEWVFLEKIMSTMGFHRKWVALMMECVRSVSYSVLINGEPKGYFHPSRGLRQGDPISLYLFLFCAEGLHALLSRAAVSRQLQGLSISRGGPKLTHLFFADDSVLFCRATLMECNTIMEILRKYERASGQQINQDKTTLFFSASTTDITQEEIKHALQLPVIKHYETYLGLPSLVGRSKYASFSQLKEQMWCKVQGWKEKLLTQAGKEVLIKAVIQAIPTYTMHCFKLPKKLCSDLEGIIQNFWWGHKDAARKVHWLKWSSLCRPKCRGGMGFRELMKFNEALLAKQVWRLLHNKESLFYKVFKAKFFPHGTVMEARHSTCASYPWKSILNARHVITKGTRWRIGNGLSTRIWHDKWLPPPSSGNPITPPCVLPHDVCVSSLILDTPAIWNTSLIEQIFSPGDVQLITGLVLSSRRGEDKLIWSREKCGIYSVRSAYRLLCEEMYANEPGCSDTGVWKQFWKKVWSVQVPHKLRQFLWRACTESLPTMVNMQRRCIVPSARCSFCHFEDEDVRHVLWSCPVLSSVWASHGFACKLFRRRHFSFLDILSDLFVLGLGVIIRDGQGLPIAALCKRFMCLHSVDDAEAIAAREALQFVGEIGITDAEFEGDSLTICNALRSQDQSFASFGDIIDEACLLASSLSRCSFSHVKWEGNCVAHLLARRAIDLQEDFLVWLEDVPPYLESVIHLEFVGGNARSASKARPKNACFREALDHSGLIDLRYVGPHFTWCNNHDPPHKTWVRLDRAVATTNWLN